MQCTPDRQNPLAALLQGSATHAMLKPDWP
jgi:hypothetical protein